MSIEVRFVLDVEAAGAVRSIALEPGMPLRVGRLAAGCAVPEDRSLSGEHFEILHDGDRCRLRDLESVNGTRVGGRRVTEATLRGGDEIQAGNVRFRLRRVGAAARSRAGIVRTVSSAQPLYALLDAARTPRVLELLSSAADEFHVLYDGDSAVSLAAVAPYLVRLPEKSRLLRRLLREGWGASWGIYATTAAPFDEVRRHFRRFLMVRDEDGGDFYFRFYDPRVLRAFLPACTPAEREQFFGPIQTFLAESAAADEVEYFSKEAPA